MAMALAAYRHLLRATRIAFEGDMRLLDAARQEARKGFEVGRPHVSDSEEAQKGIKHAEEVAQILRHNIVQGRTMEEDGKPEHYKLRIHDDIERGHNETIKNPGRVKKPTLGPGSS